MDLKHRFLTDKQIGRVVLLYLFNLLSLLPLVVFSYQHYSIDTYGIISSWENTEWYIGSFRFFAAFIAKLISLTGYNPILNPLPDTMFYIFIGALTATITTIGIVKLFKKKSVLVCLVADFSVLITIGNVWYTNILTFPECIAFNAVGLLCCFIALLMLFYSRSIVFVFLSSFLFICSAGTFQQFISIFSIYTIAMLSVIVTQKLEVSPKEIYITYIKSFCFIFINSVVYYVLAIWIQKVYNVESNARASMSVTTIIQNLLYYGKSQHSFLKGRGFFSTEILTVCYIMVAIVWLVSLIQYYRNSRKLINIAIISISFAVAYLFAYLPGLVTTSHGIRTICALFSVFALFSIGAITLYDNKVTKVTLTGILILVFILNIYKTVDMALEQIITNANEITYAENIVYQIEKYEKDNEFSINKIAISYDEYADTDSEILYIDYSVEPLLERELNRTVAFVEMPEEIYNENFSGKDWRYYDSDEQLIFDKDTLYLCVY